MSQTALPKTFEQALKSGYRVVSETSTGNKSSRIGKLHLKNGSRPELTVAYVANTIGYQFDKPEVAGRSRKAGA